MDRFLDEMARINPFLENRVNGPAPASVDVSDIHATQFAQVTGLAGQTLQARRGLGVVLWGEAGLGKSHLLARLGRWAESGNAHLVYLHNLQAAPEALPRSLLRAFLAILTLGRRNNLGQTPLYALVRAASLEAAGGAGKFGWNYLESLYHRWLDRLGPGTGDRRVYQILFTFFKAVSRASTHPSELPLADLAVRWLSGDALDPEDAQRLHLPPARVAGAAVALEDAEQLKQVLICLAHLAGCQARPLILALDQVDNLDEEQFASLTRFLEALLDSAPNLLVVTTGIEQTLRTWLDARVVQTSAWDRIAQFSVRLFKLTPAQSELLIQHRLDMHLPTLDHPPHADSLFPLGRAWANRYLLASAELRARDAIRLACEAWQRQQDRLRTLGPDKWLATWPGESTPKPLPPISREQRLALIDQHVEGILVQIHKHLHDHPGEMPADPAHLVWLVRELLSRCEQGDSPETLSELREHPAPRRGAQPSYHLSFRAGSPPLLTGVLVLNEAAKTAVTGFLRRLLEDSRPLNRIVVVTDERIGLPLGERGQEYLEQLQARHGQEGILVHTLTFAERAALEALARSVQRAHEGEIEVAYPTGGSEILTREMVVESHQRRGRYLAQPLLAVLLRAEQASVVSV